VCTKKTPLSLFFAEREKEEGEEERFVRPTIE